MKRSIEMPIPLAEKFIILAHKISSESMLCSQTFPAMPLRDSDLRSLRTIFLRILFKPGLALSPSYQNHSLRTSIYPANLRGNARCGAVSSCCEGPGIRAGKFRRAPPIPQTAGDFIAPLVQNLGTRERKPSQPPPAGRLILPDGRTTPAEDASGGQLRSQVPICY
jgi:hypothetical protein